MKIDCKRQKSGEKCVLAVAECNILRLFRRKRDVKKVDLIEFYFLVIDIVVTALNERLYSGFTLSNDDSADDDVLASSKQRKKNCFIAPLDRHNTATGVVTPHWCHTIVTTIHKSLGRIMNNVIWPLILKIKTRIERVLGRAGDAN